MAVPFRRTGKTAKRKRRTHYKLSNPALVLCKETNTFTLSHRVTKNSGYYKGKLILENKPSKAQKTTDN
ncbi:MAG: 50S ribosomal protein L32 [Candidatus Phytoplasma asteris]|uniref:Large ribosomal subunit protein bL32 n=2 Tax=16SrI (Aster yellows group) TaxID=3042590 RepID=RL32_ONYPE|nr:50S ribosomal protein L32 ['Chrysanthemum coronarium' phytoplasma]Q6YR20.1 RecName: Full=Large ribosomal subunit protein bL32; AltName: Full=50S ribosomal protein L32 [Onion yellows phytoplasma OY-M]TKA87595.1 MAG: 50S ribosomal protein L32 [Periwinkle leaf yellowing phytoplasma]WEX19954.1 MAG: 50S ribosomal protein L32 [Candidatus Phytoplasma asteris]BAD04283.1 ribosomal protein L32 [Onion yellows phytoplasma OY-M]GAK74280.1 ribosomal protein L32 ['Chrysanthemum coronarium' phytoplasma]